MKKSSLFSALALILACVISMGSAAHAAEPKDTETQLKETTVRNLALDAQVQYLSGNNVSAVKTAVAALEQSKKDGLETSLLAESVIVNATGVYSPSESWMAHKIEEVPYVGRMLFSESGKYLCVMDNKELNVIDTDTLSLVDTVKGVDSSDYPGGLFIENDIVYCLMFKEDSISKCDLLSYNLKTKTNGWKYEDAAFRTVDGVIGGKVLVCEESDGNTFSVINKDKGTLAYQIPAEKGAVKFIDMDADDNIYFYKKSTAGVDILTYNGSDKAETTSVKLSSGFSCSEAFICEDNVYICTSGNTLVCAGLKDGKIAWETPVNYNIAEPKQLIIAPEVSPGLGDAAPAVVLLSTAAGMWDASSVVSFFDAASGDLLLSSVISRGTLNFLDPADGGTRVLAREGIYFYSNVLPDMGLTIPFDEAVTNAAVFDETLYATSGMHGGFMIYKLEETATYTSIEQNDLPEEMTKYEFPDCVTSEVGDLTATISDDGTSLNIENSKTKDTTTISLSDDFGVAYAITFSEDGEYLLCLSMPPVSGTVLVVSRFLTSDGTLVDQMTLDDTIVRDYTHPFFVPAGKNKVFLTAFHGAYLLSFDDTLREYTRLLYLEGNGFGGLFPSTCYYISDTNRFYIGAGTPTQAQESAGWVSILDRDGLIKAGNDYLKKHGQ